MIGLTFYKEATIKLFISYLDLIKYIFAEKGVVAWKALFPVACIIRFFIVVAEGIQKEFLYLRSRFDFSDGMSKFLRDCWQVIRGR